MASGLSWNVKTRGMRGKIDNYFSRLSVLTPLRVFGDYVSGKGAKYGLDEAEFKIILQFVDETKLPLTIRFARGVGGRVFGWNSENPTFVYEFDPAVLGQFAFSAPYFFDARVFNFVEKDVSQVQLVQSFGSSWLVRKQGEKYIFSLPGYLKGKDAAGSEIELYIHTLALLRASKMILAPVAVEKSISALTIKVLSRGRKEPDVVEFFTIEDDPSMYMGKSSWLPIPFLLDVESVSQLVRSAFDVQNRTVVDFDIGSVASFVVDHGEHRYIIVRKDEGWRVRGGEKNIPGIDMSLWRFTNLTFEALPLNNLSDTAVKVMRCQLLDSDGKLIQAMNFYVDPNLPTGQCWMKSGDGMYYPVSSRLLRDLQGMFPTGNGNK
ncbi:hypothetical protein PSDVSF_06380 [Pseudodesulfovibrio sediminis]|uniref:DUF4340 domain-containing protein n=1 Tax=Pseudodesulfovibrio sediminis TaxID=2810563 RepID=A0ABN6EQG8_9BACT|nr:hypothetical protein PSDVSF_06380 [Pseudodesulfovibrio sediminis]